MDRQLADEDDKQPVPSARVLVLGLPITPKFVKTVAAGATSVLGAGLAVAMKKLLGM